MAGGVGAWLPRQSGRGSTDRGAVPVGLCFSFRFVEFPHPHPEGLQSTSLVCLCICFNK